MDDPHRDLSDLSDLSAREIHQVSTNSFQAPIFVLCSFPWAAENRVRKLTSGGVCYLSCVCFCFFFHFFFHTIYYLRRSFPLSLLLILIVVTQIRGRIAGSSPPLPTTVRTLHFYREKISTRSFLVDSRRIALTHARRSQQFILFLLQLKI